VALPNKMLVTYEEFISLQENYEGKVEYNNGEVIYMSPTSRNHNKIIRKIARYLEDFFEGSNCEVYTEQVAVVFESDSKRKEYLPDVFVTCEDAKTRGEKFTTPPKIIFEVVSRTTENMIRNDYYIKMNGYAEFGVLEYCIVEQDGKIMQYKLYESDGLRYYVHEDTFKINDKYTSTVFSELTFDLKDIFVF
jgi:Uma2 family endonuclease